MQFDWSRAVVSHLHIQNKQESEARNKRMRGVEERRDRAGEMPEGGGRLAELQPPKVVGWLRWRSTKWVAAGSERASEGRGKAERERKKQSWCSSWAEQMRLELLNIGHTSPVTVPFPPLNQLPAVCISYEILHKLAPQSMDTAKFTPELCMSKCAAQKTEYLQQRKDTFHRSRAEIHLFVSMNFSGKRPYRMHPDD